MEIQITNISFDYINTSTFGNKSSIIGAATVSYSVIFDECPIIEMQMTIRKDIQNLSINRIESMARKEFKNIVMAM